MGSLGRNAATDGDYTVQTTMTQGENQTTAARSAGIEILGMPPELDLATADGVVEQGYAAIARPARLLLLDLGGLSFCDARGLSAFVRIANHADAAGCGFGLIAPRPPVAKILRISLTTGLTTAPDKVIPGGAATVRNQHACRHARPCGRRGAPAHRS